MKLAIITDSSAVLSDTIRSRADVFILPVPVTIEGETYIEGKNLTTEEFYQKMASSPELPKTSQASLAELEDLLATLPAEGYTHVLGLFMSSGISGFYQNIQYLIEEHRDLTIAFPDTKITSIPLGMMIESVVGHYDKGETLEKLLLRLERQIAQTTAFILVDDLQHLVKGGRLSNGAALLGNLLSIKPILYFNDQGVIEVYEKVRTEKKAVKRMLDILRAKTTDGAYQVALIHSNAPEKVADFKEKLIENGVTEDITVGSFGAVIGTHLGAGAIAFGVFPVIE